MPGKQQLSTADWLGCLRDDLKKRGFPEDVATRMAVHAFTEACNQGTPILLDKEVGNG